MINYNSKHDGISQEVTRAGYCLFRRDNQWFSDNDVEVQKIIDSFDSVGYLRSQARARVVEQSQMHMQQVESEYPSFERATWPTQKAEIEAWGFDATSPTPLLDNIAIAREMDRVALLNRTLIKVSTYNEQAAYLAGTRQKIEDLIDNSSDLDFISSINFEG